MFPGMLGMGNPEGIKATPIDEEFIRKQTEGNYAFEKYYNAYINESPLELDSKDRMKLARALDQRIASAGPLEKAELVDFAKTVFKNTD